MNNESNPNESSYNEVDLDLELNTANGGVSFEGIRGAGTLTKSMIEDFKSLIGDEAHAARDVTSDHASIHVDDTGSIVAESSQDFSFSSEGEGAAPKKGLSTGAKVALCIGGVGAVVGGITLEEYMKKKYGK